MTVFDVLKYIGEKTLYTVAFIATTWIGLLLLTRFYKLIGFV